MVEMDLADYVELKERGLLRITGTDARGLLQGLITNDLAKVTPGRAIHGALLTPQGKFLHDFFIAELDGALLLDCEGGARRDDLKERLLRYRLAARVQIEDAADLAVFVLGGGGDEEPGTARPFAGGLAFSDPRLAEIGERAILPAVGAPGALSEAGFQAAPLAGYEARRLRLGLPDGSRDLEVEKSGPLEGGFDELNSIDWQKGCYIGQELTARTKYRGLLKRRLLPVSFAGPAPTAGTPVMRDGKQVGEMRSGLPGAGSVPGAGLALLRIEALDQAAASPLRAGGIELTPSKPNWLVIASSVAAR
jgi:hypothetical protein